MPSLRRFGVITSKPRMDLAGWPQDSFSQIDLGHKLALQNPFESVLIETGAVLQECEPEEILGLRSTKGILKVKEMKHIPNSM